MYAACGDAQRTQVTPRRPGRRRCEHDPVWAALGVAAGVAGQPAAAALVPGVVVDVWPTTCAVGNYHGGQA